MERYFKPNELAYELHVCEQTISRWIKAGKLQYIELSPRRKLIPESSVLDFLNSKIIRPPKKVLDRPPRSAKDSRKRSLAIRSTGGNNEREISISQLTKEISQLCR